MGLLAGGGALFTHRPEFGRLPQGERLVRIKASPHYVNGQFQNLVPVQVMSEDSGENRFFATARSITCSRPKSARSSMSIANGHKSSSLGGKEWSNELR